MSDILAQIQELAQEQRRTIENPIDPNNSSFQLHGDMFSGIQNAVQICVSDLDPLEKKLHRWKAKEVENRWSNRVASNFSKYIKSTELKEIESLVMKHVGDI